jgi:dTDP-4-amino-4,6-dideoxygalactose transaminase
LTHIKAHVAPVDSRDTHTQASLHVPFFRPEIQPEEEAEVLAVLRSGWLTTGPRTRQFEEAFAASVGARHAVAVNSATAALHLAVEALGLGEGSHRRAVLVPTLTFAATAEVVRYMNAVPILVDCDPVTLNIDFADAERKLAQAERGEISAIGVVDVVGIIPVHVGGVMVDLDKLREFSAAHDLWVVEDAAHAFPAAWRRSAVDEWTSCGDNTSSVTCFSFYANKTITTGEGGMAVTADRRVADRMRLMSLHGLSRDAWNRYSEIGKWDYQIVAPGFKYNLTDICAALGVHQIRRAETTRAARETIAVGYTKRFRSIAEIDTPSFPDNRLHAWHLYPIRLCLDRLKIDRNAFIERLQKAGVGCSVHWRPLHLHPYYRENFGWMPEDFPIASREWERLISLPLFPSMTTEEQECVVETISSICAANRA